MLLAISAPSDPNAATGMVVIILIQLATFIFAWRKDARGSEAAKKEDLKSLKTELLQAIRDTEDALEDHKKEVDRKFEAQRQEASNSRSALHEKVNEVSKTMAAVLKGQEVMEQTLTAVGLKVDNVRSKLPN